MPEMSGKRRMTILGTSSATIILLLTIILIPFISQSIPLSILANDEFSHQFNIPQGYFQPYQIGLPVIATGSVNTTITVTMESNHSLLIWLINENGYLLLQDGNPFSNESVAKYNVTGNQSFNFQWQFTPGETRYLVLDPINIPNQDWSEASAKGTMTVTKTATPPSQPLNLQATPGDNQIHLVWQVPSDDGGTPVIEYCIYRGSSSGGLYSLIGSTVTLEFVDPGVVNGQTYYYVVTAKNSLGESNNSNEVSATPTSTITTTTTTTTIPTTDTTTTNLTTTASNTESPTTTPDITPSWNGLLLLLSLFVIISVKKIRKKN